jgi:hypothetical protein
MHGVIGFVRLRLSPGNVLPVTVRPHSARGVALAWLVVLGMSSEAQAQGVSLPPASNGAGGALAVQASPSSNGVAVGVPPFWVAGVVITSARRSAMVVVLDEKRREVGVVTLREGEAYGGYRVATVEPDRVLFEQNGTVVPVIVGRPYAGPKGAADAPSRPKFFFIPGPDKPTPDLEYSGPPGRYGAQGGVSDAPSANSPDIEVIQNLLERVFSDPGMQEQIPKMRPTMQQLERVRQDRLPEVPATGSNTPPAASR